MGRLCLEKYGTFYRRGCMYFGFFLINGWSVWERYLCIKGQVVFDNPLCFYFAHIYLEIWIAKFE